MLGEERCCGERGTGGKCRIIVVPGLAPLQTSARPWVGVLWPHCPVTHHWQSRDNSVTPTARARRRKIMPKDGGGRQSTYLKIKNFVCDDGD